VSGHDDALDRARRRLLTIAGACALAIAAGGLFDPKHAWTGWLLGFELTTALALAGPFFLALLTVTGAKWDGGLRRVASALGSALPAAGLFGLVLLLGLRHVYGWTDARLVEHDELLARKAAWLDPRAFALRLVGCFVVWLVAARVVRARLGEAAAPQRRGRDLALAAGFVATFAVTWSLASVDWIGSLEPRWSSTIFALRTATSLVVSGLAVVTILVVLLRDRPALRGLVTADRLGDLGKLLLTFSIVWVYVWYCQYMLIWYAGIPEETEYYLARSSQGWRVVTGASLALGFALPFLVLLLRRARRSPAVLVRVAFVLLAGQALDLYGMVGPAQSGEQPWLGPCEVAGVVGALAFVFASALRALAPRARGEPAALPHVA
jgi:hypothetical protein